jgi:hypothetical protein
MKSNEEYQRSCLLLDYPERITDIGTMKLTSNTLLKNQMVKKLITKNLAWKSGKQRFWVLFGY